MRGAFSTLRRRVELLLVLVLIPVVFLIIFNVFEARRRERAGVQEEALRLARIIAGAQERLAESSDLLLNAVAQLSTLSGMPESCAGLAHMLSSVRRFQNVGVVGEDGTVRCSARPTPLSNVAALNWFRTALADDRLAAGRFERDTVTAGPTLVFSRRTIVSGETRVAFVAINLNWLAESSLPARLPANSSMNIVDEDGTILARDPGHVEWVGRNVRNVPVIQAALVRGNGVIDAAGIDGVVRVFGYQRVPLSPTSGFIVTIGMPLDTAYAAANRRLRVNLFVLAIVAGVTIVIARVASNRLFTSRIEALLRAARRLSAGDLSANTGQAWTDDELGELSRTFDAMSWTVAQRTEDLRQMMESLRALAARLESVREEERTRISREIHDELGQTLTGIRMDLDRLEERIAKANFTDSERAAVNAKITSARELAASGQEVARRISRQLRPSVLDVLGIRAAIEWQLEEFQARTGANTEVLVEDELADVDEQTSTALFRILQEALTNIMRHAAATLVTVRIARENGSIVMEVMDNGRGFDSADGPFPKSLGLLGMRERATTLGGLTTVISQPGKGTTVHVKLPNQQAAASATPL